MPHQQQLFSDRPDVQGLPYAGLQRHQQSTARGGELSTGLHPLPQHGELDVFNVEPFEHRLPVDRLPYDHPLHGLPYR